MATDAIFNYEVYAASPYERKIYFAAFVAAGGGEIPLKDNLPDEDVERLRNAHIAGKAAVDDYRQPACDALRELNTNLMIAHSAQSETGGD